MQLFKLADKNGNGTICKEELKDALLALGFTHLSDKHIDGLFKRAVSDGSMELSWVSLSGLYLARFSFRFFSPHFPLCVFVSNMYRYPQDDFMDKAPQALRTNLILLAKTNGNDLGFLV